jgi:hypothetical protein
LARLTEWLGQVNPAARQTWVCHSYGSLVCATALQGTASPEVDAVELVGSPGVQAASAQALSPQVDVWAGRGSGDLIELAGLMEPVGAGFGPDPASDGFGANEIPCDPGANHSDYFRQGSRQLRAMAEVALGER